MCYFEHSATRKRSFIYGSCLFVLTPSPRWAEGWHVSGINAAILLLNCCIPHMNIASFGTDIPTTLKPCSSMEEGLELCQMKVDPLFLQCALLFISFFTPSPQICTVVRDYTEVFHPHVSQLHGGLIVSLPASRFEQKLLLNDLNVMYWLLTLESRL